MTFRWLKGSGKSAAVDKQGRQREKEGGCRDGCLEPEPHLPPPFGPDLTNTT